MSGSTLLHLLLECLAEEGGCSARQQVLSTLTELLRRDCVAALLEPFSELAFLRVLQAHREPAERQVTRAAEQCAAALAARLPADTALRTLCPLARAGEFPVNRAALNTLTRLTERTERQTVLQWLPELMPTLLKVSGGLLRIFSW